MHSQQHTRAHGKCPHVTVDTKVPKAMGKLRWWIRHYTVPYSILQLYQNLDDIHIQNCFYLWNYGIQARDLWLEKPLKKCQE